MQDDSEQSSVPEEWLMRARSNLIRAKQPRPEGVFLEDFCFDAQQAVEKALKALLLHRGIEFVTFMTLGSCSLYSNRAAFNCQKQLMRRLI